jgi:hypothetical protein
VRAGNDVAREDMGGVWVGIAEEESERNDGPRIAVTVVRLLVGKSTTCTNVILTRTSESLRRISLPTTPVVCERKGWVGMFEDRNTKDAVGFVELGSGGTGVTAEAP